MEQHADAIGGAATGAFGYSKQRSLCGPIDHVIDGPGAAKGVAAFLRAAAPSGRAVLNLIPYNPGSSPSGRAPTEAEIESFTKRLEAAGALVKLRSPRGRALMAACGQLGRVDQSAGK